MATVHSSSAPLRAQSDTVSLGGAVSSSYTGPLAGSLLKWAALYLLVFVTVLGVARFGGSSEAREAQVMDTILREGEWVLPLRNGLVPSKPPLLHWFGAAVSRPLGGVTEFSSRLPSLLFATGTLLLVGFMAFRIAVGSRAWSAARAPHAVSLLSCGVLSLTFGFHQMAGRAMVDMSFTFFVTAACAALFTANRDLWQREHRVSSGARALFWVACACAVLSRGPVGIALPILITGVTGGWLFGFRAVVRAMLKPSIGWMAFLLPAIWYCAAYERAGDAFLERQLLFENVKRLTGGEHINSEAWWFYAPSMLRTTFPWGVLAVALLIPQMLRRSGVFDGYSRVEHKALFSPSVALVTGVVLFSVASGKRHSYLLPLYSFVAIQFSLLIVVAYLSGPPRFARWVHTAVARGRWIAAFIGFLVLALVCAGDLLGDVQGPLGSDIRNILSSCAPYVSIVLALGLVWNLCGKPRTFTGELLALWIGLFTTFCSIVAIGDSVKAGLKNFPALTAAIASQLEGGAPLIVIKNHYDEYFDPILFYLRRRVQILSALDESIPCNPSALYLTRSSWMLHSGARFTGQVTVIRTLSEPEDVRRGRRERELSLFRCVPVSPSEASSSMQTAGAEPYGVLSRASLDRSEKRFM